MPYSVKISDPRCKFSASHFLFKHDKCSRMHGHNYQVQVELIGDLNEQHFVVDFFILKQRIMAILDELDHAILLPTESDQIRIIKESGHYTHEEKPEDVAKAIKEFLK